MVETSLKNVHNEASLNIIRDIATLHDSLLDTAHNQETMGRKGWFYCQINRLG